MEWKKIEPKIFKFENEGDCIEGRLVAVDNSSQFGNKVYKIEANNEITTIFGTSVLDSILSGVSLQTELRIVFTGTKKAKIKGQSDMKLFEVYTKGA